MPSHATEQLAPEKKADLAALSKMAASGITKAVDGADSPDKRLTVGVGLMDGSKPEWEKIEGDGDSHSFILNSDHVGNYLIDVKADRVIGILDGSHFGTRLRYNHESYTVSWSDDCHWLLEVQSLKWDTHVCVIHELNAKGDLDARFDFMPVATELVAKWIRCHYPKLSDEEIGSYAVTIEDNARISNNGTITVNIAAALPKDQDDHPYVHLTAVAKVVRPNNSPLKVQVIKVDAIKNEHE